MEIVDIIKRFPTFHPVEETVNHKVKFALLLVAVASASLFAQQPATQQLPAPPAKKITTPPKKNPLAQPAAVPKPQGLTIDGIVSMVQAGLSEDVVIARLRKEDKAFDLSPEDMIKLKNAGVGNDTLKVMMDPKVELKPPPPLTPAPKPVVPITPVAPVAPTPGSGSPTPTGGPIAGAVAGQAMEMGVYFKRAGVWMEVLPEVVNWKTGGTLKNLATANIVKKDLNGNLTGPASRNSVTAPLEFLIVAAEGVSITEYQLIRLRLNKDYREFRTVTGGILNQQSGAMRDLVPFEGKKLSPRTFSVVLPNNLGAGEYGFLSPGAVGSSGNSQAQIGKMYTFHIIE
jgi:hypothetical protein